VLVRRSVVAQRMELLAAQRERQRQERTLAALTGSDALFTRTFGPSAASSSSNGLRRTDEIDASQSINNSVNNINNNLNDNDDDDHDLEGNSLMGSHRTTPFGALGPHASFRRAWHRDTQYGPFPVQDSNSRGDSRSSRGGGGTSSSNASRETMQESMAGAWNAMFGSVSVNGSNRRGFHDLDIAELEAFTWTALRRRVGAEDRWSLLSSSIELSEGAAAVVDRSTANDSNNANNRSFNSSGLRVSGAADIEAGENRDRESSARDEQEPIAGLAAEVGATAESPFPLQLPPQLGIGQRRHGRRNAVIAMSTEVLAAARAAAADVGGADEEEDGDDSGLRAGASHRLVGSGAGVASNMAEEDGSFPRASGALPVRCTKMLAFFRLRFYSIRYDLTVNLH